MTPESPDDLSVISYPLPDHGQAWLPVPKGAVLMCVKKRFGVLTLWAMQREALATSSRAFVVTDDEFAVVPPGATYIDTVLTDGGAYVRHVFEITECLP